MAAERRHAVGPALFDGSENLCRLAAVNPLAIHERRAGIAAALCMAAIAVVGAIKPLALGDFVGILLVAADGLDFGGLPPGLDIAETHGRHDLALVRRSAEAALLAFAAGEQA